VLPVGADAEVGGEPTAAADIGAGAAAAIGVGRWSRGGTPSGATIAFLFLVSLWAWIASFVIMILLTNSGNVPPVLSTMRSCSLVERPIMKRSFFFSSVST
jgi:hypothetical protein